MTDWLNDKDLVELLRSDYAENFADQAADRIEKLSQDYAEACDEAAVCYIKQCKAESKLDKALAALDEAIYMLNPDEEDMAKKAGVYRIVTTYKELKGET